ncbi:hypothetical protein SAMN05444422_10627 [Halobiforma haloterrestris]|uniref:Ribbon-helix-helix protein, copG family n=1 Tax=Natronobacterium haloterrestre TaxID=148448 RepID=A0A1I1HKZ8_NATHA|nr:hypothetical protein [Halobiforma haloterrestris]SFC24232.1 hypothetical protein SAMN05444422_10627 [Halobiforma haloterrestris]
MPQVNVELSDEQFSEWTEWVDEEKTPHNTKSDLIRTAVNDYINESQADRDLNDIDEVVRLLESMQRDINGISGAVEQAHEEQLTEAELSDSVDATVRKLLYDALVQNEAVDGISLAE